MKRHPLRRLAMLALLAMALPILAWGNTQHPNVKRGLATESAFQIGDIDHVNLFNGGLTITVPIGGRYDVGADLSYSLNLVYSNQLWDWETLCDTTVAPPSFLCQHQPKAGLDFNAGFGWMVNLGLLIPPSSRPRNESGQWLYVGPDGAERRFYNSLVPSGPTSANVYYSRDNSYLRLKVQGNTRTVEFPNGEIHTFDSSGQLTRQEDRYGNYLSIARSGSGLTWTLRDGRGSTVQRTHTIQFVSKPMDQGNRRLIKSIRLAAFGGQTATYTFDYEEVNLERPCPYEERVTSPFIPALGPIAKVQLLRSVTFPDGSQYWMPSSQHFTSHSTGCAKVGLLKRLRLPTMGEIEWNYAPYVFPQGNDGSQGPDPAPQPWQTQPPGVISRTLRSVGGSQVGTWTYTPSFDLTNTGPLQGGVRPVELVRTVVSPENDKTVYYFAGHIAVPPETNSRRWEYGLPYSPLRSIGSGSNRLYKSAVFFEGNGNNARRTLWVRYERDPGGFLHAIDLNRREVRRRLDYTGGTFAEERRSDFDGLGHYRTMTTAGNFGSANVRTEYTNYNPGNGVPSPSQPWILETYTETRQTEGSASERQTYCFDSNTGALLRKRLLQNAAGEGRDDVLVNYSRDARGQVFRERYFGADSRNLSTSANLCTLPLTNWDYRIDHEHAWGSLRRSRYWASGSVAMPFYSVDLDIDRGTGLAAASRDVSGLQTDFEFDQRGRVTWIKPAAGHGAWRQFIYDVATNGNNLARVRSLHRRNGSKTNPVLDRNEIVFDAYGRVAQERELMPAGVWVGRTTRYNAMGWVTRRSERQSGNPSKWTLFLNHDAFGRPRTIQPPDGPQHNVTLSYSGVRSVSRTVRVRMSGNTASLPLTAATTVETFDRQGRLWKVDEPIGGLHATFSYDAGNRLTKAQASGNGVNQVRELRYDGRGFLKSERHPEKASALSGGWIDYNDHDARGHARQSFDNGQTLVFDYDKAERLVQVRVPNGRTIKGFVYGGSNSGTNRRLGRLWKATRHNRAEAPWAPGSFGTISVTDEYEYRGRDGRVSHRTTRIGPNTAFRTTWAYDDLGQVIRLGYPRCTHSVCTSSDPGPPRNQAFTYDNGRLRSASGGVNFIGYHDSGLTAQISFTNQTLYRMLPDPNGMRRPADIRLTLADGTDLGFDQHRYDGAGNLIARGNNYFHYDRLSRLTRFQMGDQGDTRYQAYGYDTFGNLQSLTHFDGVRTRTRAFAMNRPKNQLSAAVYDGRGNLLRWGTEGYRWDELNSLVQRNFPAETYIYDAEDRRVMSLRMAGTQIAGLHETYSLRDLDGKVLTLYRTVGGSGGAWDWDRDYVHDDQGRMMFVHTDEAAPRNQHFFALDHLGSPLITTDAQGAFMEQALYWGFGEDAGSTTTDVRRFTGHERDPGRPGSLDDLDYMLARYYSPWTGRFLSLDPSRESFDPKNPQSWNRYAYVLNNPLKLTDPTGEVPVIAIAIGLAVSGFLSTSAANAPESVDTPLIPPRDLPLDTMAFDAALGAAGPALRSAGRGAVQVGAELVSSLSRGVRRGSRASRAIPLPSLSGSTRSTLFASATRNISQGGVTAIGRALQKHASRPGSFFQSAGGNAAQNAKMGASFLKFLLNNSASKVSFKNHRDFGLIIKIRLPNGAGAQFTENGKFIGLLEPFKK
ncbi:MAG: RHS repeat-associated core domain-containing protein [Acidobacteriota bacterium]